MKFLKTKKVPLPEILRTCIGTVLGIGGVAILAKCTQLPFIIAPFGASAVLIYSAVASPLAQPRNVVLGHLVSGVIAITVCNLFDTSVASTVLAVTVAIVAMMLLDAVHPPGGATALLCMLQNTTSYTFLLTPLAAGCVVLLLAAIIASKIVPGTTPYPTPKKTDNKVS